LNKKFKWNKILRDKIEKKLSNLKKIKSKININQMNENQNWTQLNFGRAGIKSKVRKEKKYRKGKKKGPL
jgi:hypothetical protein